MFADICTGLISILTPETIGAVALGIFTGLMFGAIPGISGIMAISILLPLTFYVSPLVGIPMLLGIYKASMFGGSITAVPVSYTHLDVYKRQIECFISHKIPCHSRLPLDIAYQHALLFIAGEQTSSEETLWTKEK